MDPTIYVIGDLHLGHRKVEKFRPFGPVELHDRELIQRWNSVVRMDDTVYLLGDAVFGERNLLQLGELKGIKKLVMGNHDTLATQKYLWYFNKVYAAVEFGQVLLTHIPVHPGQFDRYAGNIHGHLHEKPLDDPRYICVSAEQVDYTPTPLKALVQRFQ